MRAAAFQSEYDVACDTLNDNLSNASLHTIMAHRRDELQKICGEGESLPIYLLAVDLSLICKSC